MNILQHIDYILKYRRFKVSFIDVYNILFVYIGCLSLVGIGIFYIVDEQSRVLFFFVSMLILAFLVYKILLMLLQRLSFEYIDSSFNSANNIKAIQEVLHQYQISYTFLQANVLYCRYPVKHIFYPYNWLKQEGYFIVTDNQIFINFRTDNPALLFNVKDTLQEQIKNDIIQKTSINLSLNLKK